MRAYEFLREYSREKTANVFGNKLIAALAKDKSYLIQQQGLDQGIGKARAFVDQKIKAGSEITPEQRQYILDLIMHILENSDPTPNKEYVQWLAKVYANQGIKIEDILSRGNSSLLLYHQYKAAKILPAELRDIGRLSFSDLEYVTGNPELRQAYQSKQQQQDNKTADKGESTVVFENAQVRIIVPHNEEAACYYGQGTRWCTAARENNMYKRYAGAGDLYILLPKQPKYDGEKYQLHFDSGQFMDEGDDPVEDIINLIQVRFGDLTGVFRKLEPEIKNWIIFTDEITLKPLLDKIATAVTNHAWEIVNEWETTDDYWWDYLRGKGYVYPEGHEEEGQIDWDAVANADESYTDWNYDAADFLRDIRNAVELTPKEVIERTREYDLNSGYDPTTIDKLEDIIMQSIENERGRDGDGGIAKWVGEHIQVFKTGTGWDVKLVYVHKDGTYKEYKID